VAVRALVLVRRAADVIVARGVLAIGGRRALARHVAADAIARVVAHLAHPTYRVLGQFVMRLHAVIADVVRARVAVVGARPVLGRCWAHAVGAAVRRAGFHVGALPVGAAHRHAGRAAHRAGRGGVRARRVARAHRRAGARGGAAAAAAAGGRREYAEVLRAGE